MTFKADKPKERANYYSIKEASFRLETHKDDPEAIARPYTNPKTSEDGVAYEKVFPALYSKITNIIFSDFTLKDGTVLRNINIELEKDENDIKQIISLPVDSRYTTDFLTKLPLIPLSEEVKLQPYDFEKDGPRRVGIAIHTRNKEDGNFTVKVENNFFTKVEEIEGEKKYTQLYGFPEATEEDSQDWPFYFKKVNKFLVSYAKQNILPKFEDTIDDAFFGEKEEPKASIKDFTPNIVRRDLGEVDESEIPF